MNFRRSLLTTVFVGTACAGMQGQVVVTVRPARPIVKRVVAPAPAFVWIEEEWVPRGRTYVFTGGRWAAPPRAGLTWVPGHWRQRPRGWVWVPGRWR